MRTVLLASLAAAGMLGGCRAPVASAASEPPFHAAIRALNAELERRFRAGDLLGVADLYADDAVLIGPDGERVEGREAIDAYWSRITGPQDWRLEIREIGGTSSNPYELGRSSLTVAPGGEPRTSVVDFLVLWKPAGDSYRIALDLFWPPDGRR
jgi:ketosteroid isomerase-like protein